MRHRYSTRLRRMHELVVAATSSLKLGPSLGILQPRECSTFHREIGFDIVVGSGWIFMP